MSLTGDGDQHPMPGPAMTQTASPSGPPPPATRSPAPTTPPPAKAPPRFRRQTAIPQSGSPQGMPLRRRWGRVAAGAFLALLGGWVSASLYISAGSREAVVVMAETVQPYEKIERDDLRTVRVAADPGVDTIDADDIDQLEDRIAYTELVEGSLLSPDQLFEEDAEVIDVDDEAVVGIEVDADEAPAQSLCGGMSVSLVISPPGAESSAPEGEAAGEAEVEGWLYRVGDRDDDSGKRVLEVVVPRSQHGRVSIAEREDRLSMAALEGC